MSKSNSYSRFYASYEAFRLANFLRERAAAAIEGAEHGRSPASDLFPEGLQTYCNKKRIEAVRQYYRTIEREIPSDEKPSPEFLAGEKRVMAVLQGKSIVDFEKPLRQIEAEFQPLLIQAIEAAASKLSQVSDQQPHDLIRIAGRVGNESTFTSREAVEEIIHAIGAAGALPALAEPSILEKIGLTKAELATALILHDAEISPTELARKVGVSRSTLYGRSKEWDFVRRTLTARDDSRIPRGEKYDDHGVEGDSEAREFDPTDEDE